MPPAWVKFRPSLSQLARVKAAFITVSPKKLNAIEHGDIFFVVCPLGQDMGAGP
jgi:hypothetical protein